MIFEKCFKWNNILTVLTPATCCSSRSRVLSGCLVSLRWTSPDVHVMSDCRRVCSRSRRRCRCHCPLSPSVSRVCPPSASSRLHAYRERCFHDYVRQWYERVRLATSFLLLIIRVARSCIQRRPLRFTDVTYFRSFSPVWLTDWLTLFCTIRHYKLTVK